MDAKGNLQLAVRSPIGHQPNYPCQSPHHARCMINTITSINVQHRPLIPIQRCSIPQTPVIETTRSSPCTLNGPRMAGACHNRAL